MELLLTLAVFVVSIFFLIKSSDYFIAYAEKLGLALRLPYFIIGIVIVAVGTSLPEFASSIVAMIQNKSDIVIGNVLGSNVANIFLGCGLMICIFGKSIVFKNNIFDGHFPILLMSTFLVVITSWDRVITPVESIFFLGLLGAYLWFLFCNKGKSEEKTVPFRYTYILGLLLSIVGLSVAGHYTVGSVVDMSVFFGFSEGVLAGTALALGTSLPELTVIYASLKKGNIELVVGNIVGSNIFNILAVLGVSASLGSIVLSPQSFEVMLPFAVIATIIYWMICIDKKFVPQEGIAMTFLYLLFLGKLFLVF